MLVSVAEDLGDDKALRRREFNRRLAAIAKDKIRRADITGVLGSDRFALCLPYTTVDHAAIVVSRITRALEGFNILIGMADTTQTGHEIGALIAAAQPRPGD